MNTRQAPSRSSAMYYDSFPKEQTPLEQRIIVSPRGRDDSLRTSPWASLAQTIVPSMFARDYVADLAVRGRHHFTTDEAVEAIGSPRSSVRAQLRRLKVRGIIAEPVRGFNMIVPAKHRSRGCLPAEQFIPQLMDLAGEPYYFALLSAAERYGAAHQRPQLARRCAARRSVTYRCRRRPPDPATEGRWSCRRPGACVRARG